MKAERRFETDDSVRDTTAGEYDPSLEIKRTSRREIQPTLHFGEQALIDGPPCDLIVYSILTQVSGRGDRLPIGKFLQAFYQGNSRRFDVRKCRHMLNRWRE